MRQLPSKSGFNFNLSKSTWIVIAVVMAVIFFWFNDSGNGGVTLPNQGIVGTWTSDDGLTFVFNRNGTGHGSADIWGSFGIQQQFDWERNNGRIELQFPNSVIRNILNLPNETWSYNLRNNRLTLSHPLAGSFDFQRQ